MTYLTIFSAPKPFTQPHINVIQRNAIQSWRHLGDSVDVILVGDEEGLEDVAEEYTVKYIKDVGRNEYGTPLISSIFQLAEEHSDSPLLAYVNADIILFPDFVKIAEQIARQAKQFLTLGQRWDLDVDNLVDFNSDWVAELQSLVLQRGKLHPPSGSDYFLYPRGLFKDIPDFAVGRAGWDNWMIYHARKVGWKVIDATPSLMIVHQNHDYSHLPGGKPHYDLEETKINASLGGGMRNMYITLDATHIFADGRIQRPRMTIPRFLRTMERWIRPRDDSGKGLRYRIARSLRRTRRKLVKG